jgi:hypothetical protein
VQTFDPLDLFSHNFGNHATVADEDYFFQAVEALHCAIFSGTVEASWRIWKSSAEPGSVCAQKHKGQ